MSGLVLFGHVSNKAKGKRGRKLISLGDSNNGKQLRDIHGIKITSSDDLYTIVLAIGT